MAWLSDAEYVFQQDIKEKKQTGRGAFHKKGGSKSKKCNFPSDYMTRKEKLALNGEVMSYNPNKFYELSEFKQLPMEYQIKYINSLLLRYNCGLKAIAEVVFHRNSPGLYNYFKRKGQQQYLNSTGTKGGHATDAGRKRLEADVAAARAPKPVEEIQNESEIGESEDMQSEAVAEPTLEEKVAEAIDTVTLFASNNVPMPPEKIDEVFIEKTGMTREDAEKAIGIEWDNPGEPVGNPEYVEATEAIEDSTDVKSFSIVMDHINMGIIQYVSGLFNGKKISVSIEAKQIE